MVEIFAGIALVPVIVGLVEVFKRTGLPDQYAPIASLILGLLVAGLVALSAGTFTAATILTGIAYGLSASGLYSGVKAVTE